MHPIIRDARPRVWQARQKSLDNLERRWHRRARGPTCRYLSTSPFISDAIVKLHVVVVASIVAATAVLGSCADMDRVSASLTEPTADLSLGPGWDWDGIGIATGGGGSTPKPCEGGPPEPTGDGPLVQHGDVGVANECPPDPWDPPEICYHYVAYAPPLVWGGLYAGI